MKNTRGDIIGVVGLALDITERKRASDELAERKQFIESIVNLSPDILYIYDIVDRHNIYSNDGIQKVLGYSTLELKEMGSQMLPLLMYPDDFNTYIREILPRYAIAKDNERIIHSYRMKHRNGKWRWLNSDEIIYKREADGTPRQIFGMIHDITESKLAEEDRFKTQKLESIGTLAGGIAHDFNNLLQGVFGYISMAKMTIGSKEKSLAMLEQAEKSLHQSVNLTTQLLTFSKGGKPVKTLINLRPVIEDSAKFALSGSRSDLRMNIPNELWPAEADGGQIGQVIQNIVLNADQAMPIGGTIKVTAANVAQGESLPAKLPPGDYVMIAIQDEGIGILEQYLSKIFDPYFTTKVKGSGLGLATSYSIVRNHGGLIDVKTQSGVGTTFTIYLPASAHEVRPESGIKQPESSPSIKARVLVMDGDEVIRNLSSELLSALSHDVEVARHGQEALEKYKTANASGIPFDMVILDLTVKGGMGGVETLQQLIKIDPHVKAVVSSGYSDDSASASYLSQGFKAYLKKPYAVNALREVVSKILTR